MYKPSFDLDVYLKHDYSCLFLCIYMKFDVTNNKNQN